MDKLVFLRRWLMFGVTGVLLFTVAVLIGACSPASAADTILSTVTVQSAQDPFPGHEGHQLAILIPPDTSGKV